MTINLKTVETPVLTMFLIIIFDVVTPYMHFTIHNPSHFTKKLQENMFVKKNGLPLKLLPADIGILELTPIFHKKLVRFFKDFFS